MQILRLMYRYLSTAPLYMSHLFICFLVVHGQWSGWLEWSLCDRPCGIGRRVRKRYCDNPKPKYRGRDCAGNATEYAKCNLTACIGMLVKGHVPSYFQIKIFQLHDLDIFTEKF